MKAILAFMNTTKLIVEIRLKKKKRRKNQACTGFWNQHDDQLPIGFLAQLVERCTGIAEVMG